MAHLTSFVRPIFPRFQVTGVCRLARELLSSQCGSTPPPHTKIHKALGSKLGRSAPGRAAQRKFLRENPEGVNVAEEGRDLGILGPPRSGHVRLGAAEKRRCFSKGGGGRTGSRGSWRKMGIRMPSAFLWGLELAHLGMAALREMGREGKREGGRGREGRGVLDTKMCSAMRLGGGVRGSHVVLPLTLTLTRCAPQSSPGRVQRRDERAAIRPGLGTSSEHRLPRRRIPACATRRRRSTASSDERRLLSRGLLHVPHN